jgi:hypothetical protein
MRVVGRFDPELHAAFRAGRCAFERLAGLPDPSPRELAKRELDSYTSGLLGELYQTNAPLVRTLVNQRAAQTPGAHDLPLADRDAAGVTAFLKAMDAFDPALGTLSTYLRRKVIWELQEGARLSSSTIVMKDRARPPPAVRFDGDARLDWLLSAHGEASDDEPDDAETRTRVVVGPDREPPPAPPSVRERVRRDALDVFLEEHCRFTPAGREAARAVRLRLEVVAFERGEYVRPSALRRALERRGARGITMRVPWASKPVWGWRGLLLQSGPRAP